jgi:hypothetical protein
MCTSIFLANVCGWVEDNSVPENQSCSNSANVKSTGLDLDACKILAEEMNGNHIYWQSPEETPVGYMCHIFTSCNSFRNPAHSGTSYKYISCPGMKKSRVLIGALKL